MPPPPDSYTPPPPPGIGTGTGTRFERDERFESAGEPGGSALTAISPVCGENGIPAPLKTTPRLFALVFAFVLLRIDVREGARSPLGPLNGALTCRGLGGMPKEGGG